MDHIHEPELDEGEFSAVGFLFEFEVNSESSRSHSARTAADC